MRRFLLKYALFGAISIVAGMLASSDARAWSNESTVREGCHEMITFAALDAASWPDGATPPAPTANDTRLLNDLPFEMPARHRNIWAATVVLANREVDLGGHEPDDLPELSHYHAAPDTQALHCLRAPEHDGPQGDDQALAQCRAHILSEIDRALGPSDTIDLGARESQPVYLVFRHSIDVSLPRFHYHLGRALHALQDGFSHSFRDPARLEQVRHVLNYTDHVGSPDYSPSRDGFEHLRYLDACVDVDDLQERRALMAAEASAALINALADGTGGRAGRMARAEEVLVRYLSKDPDVGEMACTAANDWCSAPEPALSEAYLSRQGTCAVSAPGEDAPAGGALGVMLLAIAAALGVGRRHGRRRLATVAAGALAALGVLAIAPAVSADDREEAREEAVQESASEQTQAIEESAEAMGAPEGAPAGGEWGMYLMGRGSLQDAALAGGLGVRWDMSDHLTLGLDVEYNPWLNVISGGQAASPGTVNGYATGILRWEIEDSLEVRTTVHAGVAYLLDDLVDAPRGSIGPFVGIAPVGIAVRFGGHFRFVVDPGVMVPIPRLGGGVPLARVQYGVALGLQWNP